MKMNGKEIKVRGSNKFYTELDDLDWLFEQLKVKSMAQLADELKIPYTSRNVIRHRVEKYFPQEWKDQIKRERKPHTKSRKKDKIDP